MKDFSELKEKDKGEIHKKPELATSMAVMKSTLN